MPVAPPLDESFPVSWSLPVVEAHGDLSLAGCFVVYCFLELTAVLMHYFASSFYCNHHAVVNIFCSQFL
jgi:hypothetical protein